MTPNGCWMTISVKYLTKKCWGNQPWSINKEKSYHIHAPIRVGTRCQLVCSNDNVLWKSKSGIIIAIDGNMDPQWNIIPDFYLKKHMNKYWICSILIVNAPCSLKAMQRFSASSSSGPGSSSSAPGSSSEDERPSKRTKVEDKLPTIRNLCWNQLQSLEVFRTLLNIWYSFWVWTTLPKNLGWVKHVNYPKLSKVLKMPAKLFTKSVAKMLRGFRWLWRNHVVSGSANEI